MNTFVGNSPLGKACRASLLCLVAVSWAAIGAGRVQAAIVLLKDRAEPVVGTIVRDDKDQVVLRIVEEGKTRDETIPRTNIQEIVPAYSAERLASLDPAQPKAYRDYAEELRARRRDPEARDMALRLYLIAAWLDREGLGRSGLLGMVSLARTEEEEKKFRAALFLNDPRTPLKSIRPSAPQTDTSAPQDLLRALRLLRAGKGTAAKALAVKPAVTKLLESYSHLLTKAEFSRAVGATTLSPRELRQVLLLELEMEAIVHPTSSTERASNPLNWSRELQGEGGKPVPSFALESLTEFDPRKCWYREGQWLEKP